MCKIERAGETVKIDCGIGGFLEKVGEIVLCQSGSVLYRQINCIKKFTQKGRSKSLRIDRVNVKKMLAAAS